MPYAVDPSSLADFQQQLVGTWVNKPLPGGSGGAGGPHHPFSYNIMPLPQVCAQPGDDDYQGYILKNFAYHEKMRFEGATAVASPAAAPNRGGRFNQIAMALFYDQQVKFAEGPQKNDIVHIENGAWLSMSRVAQGVGPYGGDGEEPGRFPPQPSDLTIAKQIAVPHGNSILALGHYEESGGNAVISGAPDIPTAPAPYPRPGYLSVKPYTTTLGNMDNFQNPNPDAVQAPNKPIRDAIALIAPNAYMHWHVTTRPTQHGDGAVTNIPFEERVSKVTEYIADYWLLSKDGGSTFDFLCYTQTILMDMIIRGHHYICPHVTCNTITRE